jgi:hypothetical protein
MNEASKYYAKHGSFGNNTTIPTDEHRLIAASKPDNVKQKRGRQILRGEEALDDFYKEWGLKPPGKTWMDFENIKIDQNI